ncbi:MAG: HEAT repeat domain-containing protein, partial [Candidatus Omnitrophota bacterium]
MEEIRKGRDDPAVFVSSIAGSGAPGLEALIELLRSEDPSVRYLAIQELGSLGDVRAVEPLIALLYTSINRDEEISAINALGALKDPQAVEVLNVKLQYSDEWRVRAYAAKALGLINDPLCVEPLIRALSSDRDSDVRNHIVESLVNLGPLSVPPMIDRLSGRFLPLTRMRAVIVLGKIRDPSALKPLIYALGDELYEASSAVIDAIAQYGPSAVTPLLRAFRVKKLRKCIIQTLGDINDDRTVKPLIAALQLEDNDVRSAALKALGMKRAPEALTALIGVFVDTDAKIRGGAVEAVSEYGRNATGELLRALEYPSDTVQQCALGTLSLIKDPVSTGPVIRVLETSLSDEIRKEALITLGKIRDKSAFDSVASALTDKNPEIRERAANALGYLNDARALEPLIDAFADNSASVAAGALRSLRDLFLPGQNTAAWRDVIERIRMILDVCNGAGVPVSDFCGQISDILIPYAKGLINDKKVKRDLKNIRNAVTLAALYALGGMSVERREFELFARDDPKLLDYFSNLISVYYQIHEEDVCAAENLREAFKQILIIRDRDIFNRWLYTESALNKPVYENLVRAGYNPMLWSEGIKKILPSGEGMTDLKESIYKQTYQLIEIAQLNKIAYPAEIVKLVTYNEAETFAKNYLFQNDDIRQQVERILHDTRALEHEYRRKAGLSAQVTVEIKFDFLNDSYAGNNVPGCFSPVTGIHKEMPLIHALEADAVFLNVYNHKEILIANAVLFLTDEGIVVQPLYNSTNLDIDRAVFEVMAELLIWEWVPAFLMENDSAGFEAAAEYLEIDYTDSRKKLYAQEEDSYYVDTGDVEDDHVIFETGYRLTAGNLRERGYTPLQELFLNKNKTGPKDAKKKDSKRAMVHALFDFCREAGLLYVDLGPVIKNIEEIYDGQADLEKILNLLVTRAPPGNSVSAEARSILRDYLADIQDSPEIQRDGGIVDSLYYAKFAFNLMGARIERATIRHLVNNARSLPRPDARAYMDELMLLCRELGTIHSSPRNKDTVLRMLEDTAKNREEWLSKQLVLSSALRKTIGLLRDTGISGLADSDGFYDAPVLIENLIEYNSRRKNLVEHVNRLIPYMAAQELDPDYMSCILLNLSSSLWSWGIENLSDQDACSRFARVASLMLNVEANHGKAARILMNALRIKDGMLIQENILTQGLMQHSSSETIRTMFEAVFDLYEEKLCEGSRAGLAQQDRARLFVKNVNAVQRAMGRLFIPYHPHRKEDERYLYFSLAGNDVFALEDTLNLDEIDENSLGEFLEEYCTRKDLKTLYSKITDLSLYMRTEGLPSGQVIRVLSGLLARGRKTSANLKQFKEILPVLNAQSRANIIFISRLLGNGAFSERFYRMLVRNNGDLTPVMKALLFPKRSNESNERFRKIFIEELAECAGDYELNQDQFDILWHAFSFSQDKTRQYYLLGDMIAQEAGLKNPGISLPRELREALETADPIRLSVNSRVNKAANFARFGHKIPPVFYDQKIGYNVFCDMAERFGDFNKVAKLFVLIQKLFAEGISHFTIENLFMNVCLVEFAPSDILLNFLLEEENKVLLKEKVALAQHMIVNRADPDILSYIIKFGELKINHKDELSYYRGINAMLVNKAMSSDDGIEDWHIFLNGYIPAFGYLANPDLVRVHRSLAKEAPLDSEELKKYNLAKIGITATGREGIGQFGAVIARMSRDIISQRQLDASYLDSPLTEAMVGAMTSFYTGFGHGANGAFTLKGFVQEFNRARNNGKIPALDKAYLQEDDFDAHKKKARTEFMKETVKLFSYYQNVLCQASELVEKYSVPDRVSLMKARLRESIDKRMQALNAGLADNTSLQKKDFIRQEIDVLTQLKEKTARSNDLLDISVIIADSLLSRAAMLRDDLIICLIAYTFEAYPNVKDEAMPGIKKGLSIGALDKIIELKEVFIKEHILEGLEKNTKRLILKNILNIEQFKKEIDNEELFGDTTSVHVFSTKGIFGEMAGDIGDACYTKENLIMGRKDLTAVLFTTGEGLDIRFIGSMLVLENSYKGKKALILRAINPTDAFIEEYSTADFIKGAIGYARKIAAANGNAVIVAPVGSEHALTNRHGYVDKEMEKYVADKELIALDKKEDFNGYGITRLCAVISAEPESAAQRDGGNFTDESRQGAPGSEGLSTVEADINPSAGAPVSLEEYRNDIRASEERGDIIYYTAERNIDDEFAPEQGLKTTNTRGLEKVRAILDILLDDASRTGTALSVVDIGAGSGEACLEAYKAAKAAGVRLIMQTIGLTPIPSRLALKQTADGIRKIIAEIVLAKKLKANPAVKEYLSTLKHLKGKDLDSLTENGIGPVYYDSRVIPMSLAFTLQAGGHEIFERLNEPYIQKQHIGRLTEIDIDQQFDLVYDQWGGFNYSVQEIGLQETLEKTLPLLSGKGILFVESLPEFLMYKLKSINVPEGFTIIAFGPRNRRGMIAFRKGSPYERRLGRLLAPNKRLGEVYVIEDLSGIVDRLRNVKADVQAGKDGGAAESDMLDWTNRKNLENIAPEDNYIKDTNSLAAGKASWVVFDDEST